MTDDRLLGCRLKLQQAQRHLWELKAEIEAFRNPTAIRPLRCISA